MGTDLVRARREETELVPAETGEEIAAIAQHAPKGSGEILEQVVAHLVAAGVVHRLEVVEIDHHDR